MPAFTMRIVGLDAIEARLRTFSSRLAEEVGPEFDVVGADMVDFAKSVVPIRTGFLHDSIYHSVTGMTLDFGATADYALFVEFGTCRMGARPFLRPAFEGNLDKIYEALRVGVTKAMEF